MLFAKSSQPDPTDSPMTMKEMADEIVRLREKLHYAEGQAAQYKRRMTHYMQELAPDKIHQRRQLADENRGLMEENGTLRVELDAALKRAADMTDLAARKRLGPDMLEGRRAPSPWNVQKEARQ